MSRAPSQDQSPPLTYQESGVDIGRADTLVAQLRQLAARTHGPQVLPHNDAYAVAEFFWNRAWRSEAKRLE